MKLGPVNKVNETFSNVSVKVFMQSLGTENFPDICQITIMLICF